MSDKPELPVHNFVPERGYLSLDERAKMQRSVSMPNDCDVIGLTCLPEQYRYGCLYSLDVAWDQWARATLTCDHGKYVAVSDFLNITEAIMRASVAFNSDPVHQEKESND